MRYNIKASSLPLIVGIALAIVSLSLPWMVANHYIEVGGKKETADNYIFFMWGQRYTVTGTKLIQSITDVYDYRDFPFYSMVFIIIAIALGAFTFLAGRGTILNVRGRLIKFKAKVNPLIPLAIASTLLLLSWLYIQTASQGIVQSLQMRNYVVEPGPSLDFLMLSLIAYIITILMTGMKFLKKPASPKPVEGNSTATPKQEQVEKSQTQSEVASPVIQTPMRSANPFSVEFIETKLRIIDILSSHEAPKTAEEIVEAYYGKELYVRRRDSTLKGVLAELVRDGLLMETTKADWKAFEIKKTA